jgi:hypothetical protein
MNGRSLFCVSFICKEWILLFSTQPFTRLINFAKICNPWGVLVSSLHLQSHWGIWDNPMYKREMKSDKRTYIHLLLIPLFYYHFLHKNILWNFIIFPWKFRKFFIFQYFYFFKNTRVTVYLLVVSLQLLELLIIMFL